MKCQYEADCGHPLLKSRSKLAISVLALNQPGLGSGSASQAVKTSHVFVVDELKHPNDVSLNQRGVGPRREDGLERFQQELAAVHPLRAGNNGRDPYQTPC